VVRGGGKFRKCPGGGCPIALAACGGRCVIRVDCRARVVRRALVRRGVVSVIDGWTLAGHSLANSKSSGAPTSLTHLKSRSARLSAFLSAIVARPFRREFHLVRSVGRWTTGVTFLCVQAARRELFLL